MFPCTRATCSRLAAPALGMLLACAVPAAAAPGLAEGYGQLPLSFEVNVGQVDRAVRFLGRGPGYALFLTPTEAVLSLSSGPRQEAALVRLQAIGGNAHPRMIGESLLPTKTNYLLGNDPDRWHTGIRSYARVRVEEVYPGVDLIYRGNQRRLEYDFVIDPGADPRRIRLAFRGAESITIGERGELILHTAHGDLVQPAPFVYQETAGARQQVDGHYVLFEDGDQVGFRIGRYDRSRRLIIDPVLLYSTFLGGGDGDQGFGMPVFGIAVDGAGNAYVAGETRSSTFPGVGGGSIQPLFGGGIDAFVTKVNAEGTAIVYSTFLGGAGPDVVNDIAVDGLGNAYVLGYTSSTSFPGTGSSPIQPAYGGGSEDAFVLKIDPTGTAIVYSTFLGGSGSDAGFGIAVDGPGNAYVTGLTTSTTFPGVTGSSLQPANAGLGDVFLTKIDAAGAALVYSTFLGSSSYEQAFGLALDGAGQVYLTGTTLSATFPGVTGGSIQPFPAGGNETFLTKIDAGGTAIVYSTFLGGNGSDIGYRVALDGAGNAYLAGGTTSTYLPGVGGTSIQPYNAGGMDAFVMKIDPAGTAIVASTFLGGSGFDAANGIELDGAGRVHLTGLTTSSAFPGIDDRSIQPVHGGGRDAFLLELDPAVTGISFSTFLGGGGDDAAYGIALDAAGSAYISGYTGSLDFPGAAASPIQPTYGGGDTDGFLVKIGNAASAVSIPTLDPRGLVSLVALLAIGGLLAVRKRRNL